MYYVISGVGESASRVNCVFRPARSPVEWGVDVLKANISQ